MSTPWVPVLLTSLAVVALTGCGAMLVVTPDATVNLNIADRAWDPNRPDPDIGWCGEACIQMALGHYGLNLTQRAINEAGDPPQADLWSDDMDRAMVELGAHYLKWAEDSEDMAALIAWIRTQLRLGYPVICGVKIYPDETPSWDIDHYVLAVGYDTDRLLVNTQLDMDGQIWVSHAQLQSTSPGYSFANRYDTYYARAVTGVD